MSVQSTAGIKKKNYKLPTTTKKPLPSISNTVTLEESTTTKYGWLAFAVKGTD